MERLVEQVVGEYRCILLGSRGHPDEMFLGGRLTGPHADLNDRLETGTPNDGEHFPERIQVSPMHGPFVRHEQTVARTVPVEQQMRLLLVLDHITAAHEPHGVEAHFPNEVQIRLQVGQIRRW